MKFKFIIIILLLVCYNIVQAQTKDQKVKINAGTDIVSSYIWRGSYNAGASFQPTLSGQIAGVTLGAWGSTDFIGKGHKELDLTLNYAIKGFTVGVTDYWWNGEGAMDYLHYKGDDASHRFEGNISYQLPMKKFPLIISWNTMFAGNDYYSNGKRAYSTYVELNHPFSAGCIDMNAVIGATPWQSPSILSSDKDGFQICNLAVYASKTFQLSDKLSLPLYTRLILNPAIEDIYMVFGVSLLFGN